MRFLFIVVLFLSINVQAQIGKGHSKSYFLSSTYNKENTLYKAKAFLVDTFYHNVTKPTKLIIDPLVSATSGELTTITFTTEGDEHQGVLFSFYGNYWNNSGVVYQGYGFKLLNKEKAFQLFEMIESTKEKYGEYFMRDMDNNNVVFNFEDMQIIMYSNGPISMRVLWGGFDSLWTFGEAERTFKRFKKFLGE